MLSSADRGRHQTTVARVVRERTDGKTAYAVARDLNKDAMPTAQSARAWSASYSPRAADAGMAFIDYGHCGLRRLTIGVRRSRLHPQVFRRFGLCPVRWRCRWTPCRGRGRCRGCGWRPSCSVRDNASCDGDLSHVAVDLDGNHVVARSSDLTADADTPDLGTGLDAQRDGLE